MPEPRHHSSARNARLTRSTWSTSSKISPFKKVLPEDREQDGEDLTQGHDRGKYQRPEPQYIGRKASASPATGSSKVHKREQKAIIDGAFSFPEQ